MPNTTRQRRKSRHGEPLRFLLDAVDYTGSECLIWPFARAGKGYGKLRTPQGEKYAHRLICEVAHGAPPTPAHECAHSCGHGFNGCITPTHLSWKTPRENAADKIRHGTDNKGEKHGLAKLTASQVRRIYTSKGKASQAELARLYGVSTTTIGRIHRRECWGWLDYKSSSPTP